MNAERLREESIEHLSRLYFNARAIERPSQHRSPLQAELASHIQQWTDDAPQIAVIGAFSAGKSTLLNRLIRRSLLPATRTPTTAVVTSIRYGARAHALLEHRKTVRVTLVSQDARRPDPAAIDALRTWLQAPAASGVVSIREIDERGQTFAIDSDALRYDLDRLVAMSSGASAPVDEQRVASGLLRRTIGRRTAPETASFSRTFEVTFCERAPTELSLEDERRIPEFASHLTEPARALSLHRATCFLPDPRLQHLSFLDTAGLCSPVGFHRDVTTELLSRRPDKILVLLDARRLDSPTNGEALKVLGRFVSAPDDYRQVTFALSFWDLALRTHMTEDSEPELDFSSSEARPEASRTFAQTKRWELTRLLTSWVGVRCEREPSIFTLGLGAQAPPEMASGVEDLWRHLEKDCRGWVGVEMWAERWRSATSYGDRLLDTLAEIRGDVESARDASDVGDLDAEERRLDAQLRNFDLGVAHAEEALNDVVEAQKRRMLAEIRSLDSKSALIAYLDRGYWESANASLNALQAESNRRKAALVDLYRGARSIPNVSLDRKLLGLDSSARELAKEEVSGVLYGLKAAWDFLFGGVIESNEGNRAAARKVLGEQARGTIDILDDAVRRWVEWARVVRLQAAAEHAERRADLAARRADKSAYVERLQRKLQFLDNCEAPVRNVCERVVEFSRSLEAARARISASQQPDFEAALYTERGKFLFRKGRERDQVLLLDLDASPWKWLEVRSGGWVNCFVPMPIGRDGRKVVFIASPPDERRSVRVAVPEGAARFELRLGTLEGEFRFAPGARRSRREVPRQPRSGRRS